MSSRNEWYGCPVPIRMGRSNARRRYSYILSGLLCFALALSVSACKNPVETRIEPDREAKARGLAAIERAGCGACHEIPGVDWPKGRLGPSLERFDDVGLIAGALPNRPATLADFFRNPRSVKPGSTMPAMPLSEQEAQDIASYLYGADHD